MTKLAARTTALCIICLGAMFTTNTQAGQFRNGMSEAEFYFLLDAGLIDDRDAVQFDAPHPTTQTTTATRKPSNNKGLSGLDLGSGRYQGLSGLDLGSGR